MDTFEMRIEERGIAGIVLGLCQSSVGRLIVSPTLVMARGHFEGGGEVYLDCREGGGGICNLTTPVL